MMKIKSIREKVLSLEPVLGPFYVLVFLSWKYYKI